MVFTDPVGTVKCHDKGDSYGTKITCEKGHRRSPFLQIYEKKGTFASSQPKENGGEPEKDAP
jgi:hypothetical protein